LTPRGGIAAGTLVAEGQQSGKVARIGLLSTSFGQRTTAVHAFSDRLKGLGYIEGRNLAIALRDGEGRNDLLPAFATELVDLRVNVIVTLGPYATQAAKDATANIPIVFAGVGENFPLARSEGNLTGVTEELIDSTAKRLEILTDAIPGVRRVGILANPDNYGTPTYLRQSRAWAHEVGVALYVYDVRDPHDIEPALAEIVDNRIQALIAFPDSIIFGQRDKIVQTALKNNLPGIFIYREWVSAGGLMAYGVNQATVLGGPVPRMVDKVLKGAKPCELPVEQSKLGLFINLESARKMGVSLPKSLLAQADEAIE
jgi:putative ABC transport system substrate-binding protein